MFFCPPCHSVARFASRRQDTLVVVSQAALEACNGCEACDGFETVDFYYFFPRPFPRPPAALGSGATSMLPRLRGVEYLGPPLPYSGLFCPFGCYNAATSACAMGP